MIRFSEKIMVISVCFLLFLTTPLPAAEKISVFVSILPQKYFVERIGQDRIMVDVMVHPGHSPAIYEPKPKQMADLLKSDLYFAIGVPFEKTWLNKIAAANPNMQVIHTDHGIEKLPMTSAHHHEEDAEYYTEAGGDHHHETGTLDPHIWLSPALVKIQATAILNALKELDPAHESTYVSNYDRFIADIDALDRRLTKLFVDEKGLQFMVFHPSWGYFAQAYGLEQVPIELEGKDPKPAQLKKLIESARKRGIKVVFAQPQFSTKSAQLIAAEIGGDVSFADPLAEDWFANLNKVAENFKAVLK